MLWFRWDLSDTHSQRLVLLQGGLQVGLSNDFKGTHWRLPTATLWFNCRSVMEYIGINDNECQHDQNRGHFIEMAQNLARATTVADIRSDSDNGNIVTVLLMINRRGQRLDTFDINIIDYNEDCRDVKMMEVPNFWIRSFYVNDVVTVERVKFINVLLTIQCKEQIFE